jgi:hypothetical protein
MRAMAMQTERTRENGGKQGVIEAGYGWMGPIPLMTVSCFSPAAAFDPDDNSLTSCCPLQDPSVVSSVSAIGSAIVAGVTRNGRRLQDNSGAHLSNDA